jgi:hypothetical protein
MSTTATLRQHLDLMAASVTTAAEALADGAALDLPPSVLAELLLEVQTLGGGWTWCWRGWRTRWIRLW